MKLHKNTNHELHFDFVSRHVIISKGIIGKQNTCYCFEQIDRMLKCICKKEHVHFLSFI